MSVYGRDEVVRAITLCRDIADRGSKVEARRNEIITEKTALEKELGDTLECANHITEIYKNIKAYSIEHMNRARDILNMAIEEAGVLVPDADTSGIQLDYSVAGKVSIINDSGQDVNLREGGGYRVILGALLRYACLKAQPDALQLMLFDETFFTLSDTTTASMKDIFTAMKKDIMIICIEQRRSVMDGILDSEYTFVKDMNKNTTVTKTL